MVLAHAHMHTQRHIHAHTRRFVVISTGSGFLSTEPWHERGTCALMCVFVCVCAHVEPKSLFRNSHMHMHTPTRARARTPTHV